MTPQQFKIVKELFDVVCDLPEDARRARLVERTDDQEVIDEVLRLAGQTSIRTTRFSTPIMSAMGAMGALAGDELKAGDKLGAWTLEKAIGHGGMGAVYLAKRSDGHFEQTAAIKLIYGVPSAAALEYLARERQILADLSHPNIARLIDGGATPMGQPYLVMEYVDGVPINRYITDNKLASNLVLVLFKQVFAAVSFAHAQLIVHCDLKPSNILVTSAGRPYLLDFGIAKLVDSANIVDALSSRSSAGSSAPLAYTPHYASPEQREGAPVSTKTDIYALGVMLRESIAEQPDDLVAIIAKATAARREQRYESVAALSDDIDRYLAKEPVSAREATATYRAQKFVQRRWPWVLVGSVFIGTVAVFTLRVISERDRAQGAEQLALKERDATQLARAEALQERDRAEVAQKDAERDRDRAAMAELATLEQRNLALRERDRAKLAETTALTEQNRARVAETNAIAEKNRAAQAETTTKQTNDFLISIFDSSSPNAESGDPPASKLVALAEKRIERDLTGQPETQASLFHIIGEVQRNTGNSAQAQKNYLRAIELERKQNRPLVLAHMLARTAALAVASFGGKNALEMASEALALCEKHAARDSEALAASLTVMGYATMNASTSGAAATRNADAQRYLVRALAIREKIDPDGEGVAETTVFLAQVAGNLFKYDDAVRLYRRVLVHHNRQYGEEHPLTLTINEQLATALQGLRQYDDAEAILRKSLALREKIHGRFSEKTLRGYVRLGALVAETGRAKEALNLDRQAVEIATKTPGRETVFYAVAANNMSQRLEQVGKLNEAIAVIEDVVKLSKKIWPAVHASPARFEKNLGRMLSDAGRVDEAATHLQAALDLSLRVHGATHREIAVLLVESAVNNARMGKLEEAETLLQRYQEMPPQTGIDIRVTAAKARAIVSVKQMKNEQALKEYAEVERLTGEMLSKTDARYWLSIVPRAQLLATGALATDRQQGRELASHILANVSSMLDADAPMLEFLRGMQSSPSP